jgi:amino acid adenylation domain-containing protein
LPNACKPGGFAIVNDTSVPAVTHSFDNHSKETQNTETPGDRSAASLAAEVQMAVERAPLMGARERRQVLQDFNATDAPYPGYSQIHELFEARVEQDPAATAIVDEPETLTYGELNRRANQLAWYLRQRGAQAGDLVPIVLPRCIGMVVAQLAVLKCGCAYVPIDPLWPKERQTWVLQDCGGRLVIADAADSSHEKLICLSPAHEAPSIARCSDTNLPLNGDAGSIAHVMYTSGSTGIPKGVMIPHRAVNRLVINNGYLEVGPTDCVVHCSNPAFDGSTFEVWLALLNGARLFVVPQSVLLEPEILSSLLLRAQATVLLLTVGLFNQYCAELGDVFRRLRCLLVGGDALNPRTIAQVLRDSPPGCLLNAYGPTECATIATTYRIEAVAEDAVSIPIGRPISNTRIYIVDEHGEPVPVGASGEIHIGGVAVAAGYWNRPQLTSERFVKDSFSSDESARMYKTGDLGRWRTDGMIEFLGRNDFQVKIRGFRIELGEIEARLSQHPGVCEAVVIAREDAPGEKRLVAYYTPSETRESGRSLTATALQLYLSESMPDYMVPRAFVMLDRFPLTPNGKLDRKALPAPESEAVVGSGYEAPEGEMEIALAGVWREILKLERISRHDDFFKLGGHSLLAVMLRSRLRRKLDLDVPLKEIFAHPVLKSLAQVLQGMARSELSPIERVSRDAPLPLSFAQQRLWVLSQMPGMSEAYHVPLAMRLKGDLDGRALRRALDRIVWRHEALRTSFQQVEDEPVQCVEAPERGFALQEQDLSAHPEAQVELERRIGAEASRPFDLQRGPLIRGQLIKLAEQDHALLITMHHIVFDGWSLELLARELNLLYTQYRAGQEDLLTPLPVQYVDYALWQRQWLKDERLESQRQYWLRTLRGAPELLELPTDRARPAQQQFVGDVMKVEFDATLTRGLRELSQRHGATLFMTVLTGWAAVLSRLSGQQEVVIGTPVANRTRTEIEGLIGFFVNTQALRIEVSGTVGELLGTVKVRTLEAQENQELPFEQVVDLLKVPRLLSHTPVFQAMLTWQGRPAGNFELPGLALAPIEIPYDASKFDLELELSDAGERVEGTLRYATALFDRITMERHVGYLLRLLSGMVTQEHRAIDELEILSAQEREQLLIGWNDTQAWYPEQRCIHELIEDQVARTPDAVAVRCAGHTLTYAELNSKANQLAHHLQSRGVGPDRLVGICLERSLEMIVGILAVLKAGGAYVPLDPSYPSERLAYMLEDSVPCVLLTQMHLRPILPADALPTIALDDPAHLELLARDPNTNAPPPSLGLTSRHLAYVIYTSGSTGQPKGAMNEHRALVNRLHWAQKTFALGPTDKVLQKTPIGFDVSVWEILHPMLAGSELVMARPQGHRDPDYLIDMIEKAAITTLHFVPSMLQVFLEQLAGDAAAQTRFPSLRRVLCSGEALGRALLQRMHEILPRVSLHNLYGPTEAAIDVTCYACDPNTTAASVSIGRPIDNTQIYILDKHHQPVPAGVIGEIYIGGAGVARGYLNRPQLTGERFVTDPFATPNPSAGAATMYQTGDLARRLPDSSIEYVGRNDFQVKIRGFRIELGEIEARLSQHPDVREAVVLAREDTAGDKRLAAYYVAVAQEGAESSPSAATLQAFLSGSLPEHMVPAAYVRLEAFPLSPNGKLDRKALPAPDRTALITLAYEAPAGEIEIALARLWQDLLKLERVGRHDDFFRIGGNSILAIQMLSRVNRKFGSTLPAHAAFEHKTVAALALALAVPRNAGSIKSSDTLRRVELTHGVEPTYPQLAMMRDPAKVRFNMCNAMWIDGALDECALRRALAALVARHDALRATFRLAAAGVRMNIEDDAPDVLRTTTVDENDRVSLNERIESLIDTEWRQPFDLQRGPLLRALLVHVGAQRHALVLSVHHIVADAWSINVIRADLAALYAAEVNGAGPESQPLPLRYGDFVAWQRRLRDSEEHQRQLAYWVSEFAALAVEGSFPVRPEHGVPANVVSKCVEVLPSADWQARLKAFTASKGVTPYVVLAAAMHVALAEYSGLEQQLIWTPISRRTQLELEQSVGLYTNLIAVAERVDGEVSVAEFLARIERKVLRAHANGDVTALAAVMKNPSVRPRLPLIGLNYIVQADGDEWQFAGTAVASIEVNADDVSMVTALEVEVIAAPESMKIVLGYDTAIFHADGVARIAGKLIDAVEGLMGDSTLLVADLLRSWRADTDAVA